MGVFFPQKGWLVGAICCEDSNFNSKNKRRKAQAFRREEETSFYIESSDQIFCILQKGKGSTLVSGRLFDLFVIQLPKKGQPDKLTTRTIHLKRCCDLFESIKNTEFFLDLTAHRKSFKPLAYIY